MIMDQGTCILRFKNEAGTGCVLKRTGHRVGPASLLLLSASCLNGNVLRRSARGRLRLLFFQGPFHAEARMRETKRHRFFFPFNAIHELTSPAIVQLLRVGPLDLAAAERASDRPAGPAGVLPAMGAVKRLVRGGGAYSEFRCLVASGLPAAFFMFPAIQFPHVILQPP